MATSVTVTLTARSRLVGEYQSAEGEFAVVWAHGLGSHRGGEKASAVRDVCAAHGWPFAAFDFHSHGDTGGPTTDLRASRLLEDLAEVRDFLAAHGHTRIGLIGSSMGGFAAAWFAALHPDVVVGCVLLAPAFRFLQRRWEALSNEQREEWQRSGRLRVTNEWVDLELGYGLAEECDRFRADALAACWSTPALIFHGSNDNVVPAADSLAFLAGVPHTDVELRLLKGGDHRLTAYKDEIATEAARFFHRLTTAETRHAIRE